MHTQKHSIDLAVDALAVAAEGGKVGIAKPMQGPWLNIFEVVLKHREGAFRTV